MHNCLQGEGCDKGGDGSSAGFSEGGGTEHTRRRVLHSEASLPGRCAAAGAAGRPRYQRRL